MSDVLEVVTPYDRDTIITVSYTHLDVYKRQLKNYENEFVNNSPNRHKQFWSHLICVVWKCVKLKTKIWSAGNINSLYCLLFSNLVDTVLTSFTGSLFKIPGSLLTRLWNHLTCELLLLALSNHLLPAKQWFSTFESVCVFKRMYNNRLSSTVHCPAWIIITSAMSTVLKLSLIHI